MSWIYLLFAGILEVIWSYSMKLSHSFTRPIPSFITLISMIASFWLLSLAMRTLPLGTAYIVWTGLGAIGAFGAGVILLGEPFTPMKLSAVILIVMGMVLIKFSG
ncbi:DMT family transporter [Halodesulfovibrio aestuarii]|uniref:Guanidinium exporter n=1 Tax=Halodesulfovibrio aestuarii TaxID=126333 RepID=A0ABV4JZZ3_9BACT